MKTLAIVILLTFLDGCATVQLSAYQKASTAATPPTLRPGQKWAIVLLDGEGHVWKTLVVRLTNIPIRTCDSDNDRQLDVISESVGKGPLLNSPVYEVSGAAMRMQLSSTACDGGYGVIGGVSDSGFEGVHMPEVLFAPKHSTSGRAYGLPIPD